MRSSLAALAFLFAVPAAAEVNYAPYYSCPAATKALVQKVLTGLGGEPALRAVKSVRKVSDVDEVNSRGERLQSRFEGVALFPNSLYARLDLANGSLTAVSTPEVAYVYPINAAVQHAALRLNNDEKLTLTKFFYEEPLLLLRNRVDPQGLFAVGAPGKVNGVDAEVLHVNLSGVEAQWFIDPSGRVIRSKVGNKITDFSDWKSVNGITVPFTARSHGDGRTSTTRHREFQINPDVDAAAVFAKPTLWMTRNALPALGRRQRARSSGFGDYVNSYMDDYEGTSNSFETYVYTMYVVFF